MEVFPGFIRRNIEGKACKLNGALYGLKESSRGWFERFHKVMIKFGYNPRHVDHTLFIKCRDGKNIVLIVYVDNIIVTGNDKKELSELQKCLARNLK